MVFPKAIYILVTILVVVISNAIRLFPLSKETKIYLGFSKDSVRNFTAAAAKHHYQSEEHTVETEDGYVLTMFRIAKGKNCREKKKQRPVLLMHGLLQNSDIFLDAGPSAGLAYLLSDACFDVWVGNQRGNNYGRKHVRWDPDKDPDFWQFSVDEIGFYDLPASIDHVLNFTGANEINYVGFSQGSGVFFAMCSERPSYCKKTGVMIGLAPAVFLIQNKSLLLRSLFKLADMFKGILDLLGIQEVFSKNEFCQEFLKYICQISESTWTERLCSSGVFTDSFHSGSVTSETRRSIFSNFLVGTSLNNLVRYGQAISSGKFQKLDFGETINLERYNSTSAPEYDLTAVTAPVVLIQGRNDKLVDIQDTELLSDKLPKVLEVNVVSDPNWTHFDMVYSQHIKAMIYPKIYEYLQKYS